MTKDEALKVALEAMNLANSSHDKMLLSDPPQSAWRYHNVDMKLREAINAIKSSLDANEFNPDWDTQAVLTEEIQRMAKRIEELEAKDEPVAWIWKYANGEEEVVFVPPRHVDASHVDAPSTITSLYTTPPQRKPLTDEEITDLYFDGFSISKLKEFARAIEAAHNIKENT